MESGSLREENDPTTTTTPPQQKQPPPQEATREWALSLVGRDWEIFWNEEEDNNGKEESSTSMDHQNEDGDPMDVEKSSSTKPPQQQVPSQSPGPVQAPLLPPGIQHNPGPASPIANNYMYPTQQHQQSSLPHPNYYQSLPAYPRPNQQQTSLTPPSSTEVANESGIVRMDIDTPVAAVSNSNVKEETEKDTSSSEDEDSEGQGSVIDDWYAGHVVAVVGEQQEPPFMFKITFVGDDQEYEMTLVPSKVRPSASGWIKRTKALIDCSANIMMSSPTTEAPGTYWEKQLPPDTSTLADQPVLTNMKKELESPLYPSLSHLLQRISSTVDPEGLPYVQTIHRVIRLRYYLQAQIHLRTCLAPIVNLHGSAEEVDGQPNPTEGYVNHLVHCARDLEQACDWYCRCWKLLERVFSDPSESAAESVANLPAITISTLLDTYLTTGKQSIKSCVAIDTSPSAGQKRKRAVSASISDAGRSTKRRKKVKRFGTAEEEASSTFLDDFDKDNLLSLSSVEAFVARVRSNDDRWASQTLADMLHALSKFLVYPAVLWNREADMILDIKSDLVKNLPDIIDKKENRKKELPLPFKIGDSLQGSAEAPNELSSPQECVVKSDDSSSEDEDERMYSFDEIEASLRALKENTILSSIDFNEQIAKLNQKLESIKDFGDMAQNLLKGLFIEPEDTTKSADKILQGLLTLEEQSNSDDHPLVNVNPIGQGDSVVTRETLQDAYQVRSFLLDLIHAERIRERLSFVMELARKGPGLPSALKLPSAKDTSNWPEMKQSLVLRAYKITVSCQDRLAKAKQYEADLSDHQSYKLRTQQALSSALEELKHLPVVTPAEEKIAIRRDGLDWLTTARQELQASEAVVYYDVLKRIYEQLQSIIEGKSVSRAQFQKQLQPNNSEESALSAFASEDVAYISEKLSVKVISRFKKASKWKSRADLIISALCMHGNDLAGTFQPSQKQPAMVDIKRIVDLLQEYKEMKIILPGYTQTLEKVHDHATNWSYNVTSTIENQAISFHSLLAFLNEQRETRPKGIIIEPTRTVYDLLTDLLNWYQQGKECCQKLLDKAESIVAGQIALVEDFQRILRFGMYPNIAEGAEALEEFSGAIPTLQKLDTSANRTAEVLDHLYDLRKSAKAVSRQKLFLTSLGVGLLKRMVAPNTDILEGSPLFMMLWYLWQAHIELFIKRLSSSSLSSESSENPDIIPDEQSPLSLADAQSLRNAEPMLGNLPSRVAHLTGQKTEPLKLFEKYISEATEVEERVTLTLTNAKTLLRGSIQKQEQVRDHLASLKSLFAIFKDRATGKFGLSLNPAIGPQLDHQIKIFGWLVKTFSYPLLHLDEVDYSAPVDEKDESTIRVPWEILVSLYERLPTSDERVGDFALLALRVKELFEAAKTWQDEISVYTMLSNRGGKRRAAQEVSEEDAERSQQMEMDRMKQLAKSPILSKVAMPREGAVNGILESSKKFEILLHQFLGNDFGDSDRAAYPDVESFIGEQGEFVLFRLTGSPLYKALKSSIREISEVADNVLAETPGKAAFDWIKGAALWIMDLEDAVTNETPFRGTDKDVLLIPHTSAQLLIAKGKEIFLEIPADLKSTLRRYGIFVSPNKQDETFRVFSKKGVAHHSIGGSTIRWCAILFECLKSDMRTFLSWDGDVSAVLSSCQTFWSKHKPANSLESLSERVGYTIYGFAEILSDLVEEGKASLVVSPSKSLLDSLYKVIADLLSNVKKISPGIVFEFSKRRHNESSNLLKGRTLLLDALLYRKSLDPDGVSAAPPNIDHDERLSAPKGFRETCRHVLGKALRKGTSLLKVAEIEDAPPVDHIESLCSLKAWEIENLMFDRYQRQVGAHLCTNEYREKARALRYNLEDKTNPTLAPKVVLGDIDALTFITMTAEDMASQKVQLERQRLAEEARKSVILTEPTLEPSEGKVPAASIEGSGRLIENSDEQNALASNATAEAASACEHDAPDDDSDEDGPTLDKQPKEPNNGVLRSAMAGQSYSSPSLIKATLAASRAASTKARPPPPPSLAASSNITLSTSNSDKRHGHGDRGTRISGKSDSNRFKIEIGSLKLTFHVGLYHEGESFPASINGFIPNFLEVIGRSPEDKLKSFLKDKMSGGKWNIIPFRLTTISDSDTTNYKKFYKEFEARNRIGVIKIDENGSKLYLITPKFHRVAKDYTEFHSKTSTYAVLLTKELFWED